MADDSALTLEDNATIYGSVTTKTNEKGILIFSRNGSVTDNIGENGAALEKVIFKGVDTIEGAAYAQTFTIANANANVTVKGLMTGNVNYEADGTLVPEGIIGDIDFKGTNGTFSINDGRAIDGAVLSTGGIGGILNFKGNGTVSGSIGTDAENSPAIINIQGDDTTNVSLANDVFVGGVNFTNGGKLQLNKNLTAKNVDFGAKGGTLEFNGNDKYIFNAVIANGQTGILNVLTTLTATDASVGTLKTINIGNANAGQSFLIVVNNANLALLTSQNSSINFGNANSKLTLTAPVDQIVTFAGSLLKGTAGGGGIVLLDGNGHNLVVDGKNGAMLGTVGNELAELNIKGDVTITGELKAQAINFSNAGQEAILTLQAVGGVTNITTAGNNLHTLVITDFDTGNGAIGTEDHRLKAVELTGNGLVTVNTKNFYSDVTTANNGQGNVKLNIEGGTTYNLGSKNNSLASVQISENSTIKGDVYSKEINIDAGKNMDFERGNNRNAKNIIIQDVLVDRDLLPRSLQLFTYLTDIKVDKLNFADAAASVHFKDAVLVNAEINGGGAIKFDENVWLKEEIKNVERLEFGPEKFAILEKNIKAANLVANKANIVLLDNLGIDADSQFTDIALDLATYELKHTGNVTYNGTLEIITYFDVTAKSGGHILVGNGANVDMSALALDSLVIKVKSRSDITKITPDTKHEVILKEAGGNFTPVAQNKVTVDTGGELNRLIRWVSDENGVVLLNNNNNGGGNPENPDPGGGDPENPGDGDNGGGNPGDGEGGVIVPIFDPKPIRDEVTGPNSSRSCRAINWYWHW